MSDLPPLIHVRPAPRASVPPPSGSSSPPSAPPSSSEDAAQTLPRDVLRARLQSGEIPRDSEVLFAGLNDWTPAADVPGLWVTPTHAGHASEASGPSSEVDSGAHSGRATSSRSGSERRGVGVGAMVAAVSGAIGLLALGAAGVYFAYFHYKPVAVTHLPKKCTIAARVDLVDWAFFSPLNDKVFPAIGDATKGPAAPPTTTGAPSLQERIKSNTGIDLDRDVREVAICVYQDPKAPTGDKWLGVRGAITIGGRLRHSILPALYESVRAEPWAASLRLEGTGALATMRVVGTPLVIGQADDGTLVIATSDAALGELREPRNEEEALSALGLRNQDAFEISAGHVVFGMLDVLTPPTGMDSRVLSGIAKSESGRLAITLGKSPKITLTLEDKREEDAKATEQALRSLLEFTRATMAGVKMDFLGEHAALSTARVRRDETRVELRIDFRYDDVDRGASELAKQIRDPGSDLRTKTVPSAMVAVGLAKAPPAPSGSAAPSASTAPTHAPPPIESPDD